MDLLLSSFFVAHDRCAMKVGTDGILLGAWAPVAGVKRILDIGTGSGLLALMLAQRTDENVIIDAVELDVDAAQQAQENIAQSPWMHRVSVHTEDAQQWIPRQTVRFDLIISNPPYYEQGVECATPQREQARYTTTLDHQMLLTLAADSITEEGFFLCRAAGTDWERVYPAGIKYGLASAITYGCSRNGSPTTASGIAGILPAGRGVL